MFNVFWPVFPRISSIGWRHVEGKVSWTLSETSTTYAPPSPPLLNRIPTLPILQLIFQAMVCMASCHELASDSPTFEHFQKHYESILKGSTAMTILFPWFPFSAKHTRNASTKVLFDILWGYIEGRKKALVPNSDTIDLLS
jgi:hypothetical protein